MKRCLLTLVVALALVWPVAAQIIPPNQSITVVDSGTACVTAPTACAIYSLDTQTTSVTIGVAGTWTGTLTFEGTNSDGVWTSLGLTTNLATGAQGSTTTASGLFAVANAGVIKVRVRATAAITGTALITVAKGQGVARAPNSVPIGTGGATAFVGGTLCTNLTAASTTGTIEETLQTCTVTGGTLAVNTRGLEIRATGSSAANANAKVGRIYFGATLVGSTSSVTSSASGWSVDATVYRTGAATQLAFGFGNYIGSGYNLVTNSTPAETLSGSVAITVKGLTTVASGDLTALALLVKAI